MYTINGVMLYNYSAQCYNRNALIPVNNITVYVDNHARNAKIRQHRRYFAGRNPIVSRVRARERKSESERERRQIQHSRLKKREENAGWTVKRKERRLLCNLREAGRCWLELSQRQHPLHKCR